jgi:hypothetical protein
MSGKKRPKLAGRKPLIRTRCRRKRWTTWTVELLSAVPYTGPLIGFVPGKEK